MDWPAKVTLGLATLGAVLGVFNTVMVFRRGSVRWRIEARTQLSANGAFEFWVEVINAGHIPVHVKEVFLVAGAKKQPKMISLRNDSGWPRLPAELRPGKAITIGPVGSYAFHEIGVLKPLAVVAYSENGRSVEARGAFLRQLYSHLQATQPKVVPPAGR